MGRRVSRRLYLASVPGAFLASVVMAVIGGMPVEAALRWLFATVVCGALGMLGAFLLHSWLWSRRWRDDGPYYIDGLGD